MVLLTETLIHCWIWKKHRFQSNTVLGITETKNVFDIKVMRYHFGIKATKNESFWVIPIWYYWNNSCLFKGNAILVLPFGMIYWIYNVGHTPGNKVYKCKNMLAKRFGNTDVKVMPFRYYQHGHGFIGNTIVGPESRVWK